VKPQFLLEPDELQEPARDPHQGVDAVVLGGFPPAVGHGVELVLQPDDRLVVVEGSVPEFGFHHLGLRPRLRLERLHVDGERVPDRGCELLGHSTP
jgi:hypothetical protein